MIDPGGAVDVDIPVKINISGALQRQAADAVAVAELKDDFGGFAVFIFGLLLIFYAQLIVFSFYGGVT